MLATEFDGRSHKNGHYVINEIKMRLNFQQFFESKQNTTHAHIKTQCNDQRPEIWAVVMPTTIIHQHICPLKIIKTKWRILNGMKHWYKSLICVRLYLFYGLLQSLFKQKPQFLWPQKCGVGCQFCFPFEEKKFKIHFIYVCTSDTTASVKR